MRSRVVGSGRRRVVWPAAIAAVVALVGSAACSHDWDPLDPRLADAASGGAAATATGSGASTSAGTTSTSTGGAGGSAASSGQGGASSSSGAGGGLMTSAHWRVVTVTAVSELGDDYSLSLEFDHAAAVAQGKSQSDGSDVRLYFDGGAGPVEIHRHLEPTSGWNRSDTMLWWSAQQPIASSATDDRYFIGYGGPSSPAPLAAGDEVFLLWDDFDGATDGTFSLLGTATGQSDEMNGVLRITATAGTIYNTADDCAYLHWPVSGDLLAETYTTDWGGVATGFSRLGGVMLRQSLDVGSRNHRVGAIATSAARNASWRLTDGASSTAASNGAVAALPEYFRLRRVGNSVSTAFSTDGTSWTPLSDGVEFGTPLADPVLVGIPLATFDVNDWVETDWLRVRRLVTDAPSVAVGAETNTP